MYTIATQSTEDMMQNINSAKDAIIRQLEIDGILSEAHNAAAQYCFVPARKGILGRAVEKWFGIDDNTLRFVIMKTGYKANSESNDSKGGES